MKSKLILLIALLLLISSVFAAPIDYGNGDSRVTLYNGSELDISVSFSDQNALCQAALGVNRIDGDDGYPNGVLWLKNIDFGSRGFTNDANQPLALPIHTTSIGQGGGGMWKTYIACKGWGYTDVGDNYYALYTNASSGTTPRTITVNVKNLAGQPLETPIDISLNDMSGSSVGYTDVNGNYTTTLNIGSNTSTHITLQSHGIYEQYDWDFNFDSTPWYAQLIMFQASPSGTYRNITYHVHSTIGMPLNNVWLTHIISPSAQMSEYTDVNGNASFINVPVVGDSANYQAYKSGFQQSYGAFSFTGNMEKVITLYPVGVTPTPTTNPTGIPTTIPPAQTYPWYMSIIPNAVNVGDSATIEIGNTNGLIMNRAQRVLYYENDNIGINSQFRLIGTYSYNTTSHEFDFRENNSAPWRYGTDYDNYPFSLIVSPAVSGSTYTYQATVYGNISENLGTTTGSLAVGAQGGQASNLQMILQAIDGSNSNHLSTYHLQVVSNGITQEYDVGYSKTVSLQRGTEFIVTGSKEGYETRTKTFTVPVDQNIIAGSYGAIATIELYPLGVLTTNKTTLTVFPHDADNQYPVGGVDITVNGVRKTNSEDGGGVWFVLNYNTNYTIYYSKVGYCAGADSVKTTNTSTMFKDIWMKQGTCLPPSPIPTRTYTPIPTTQPAPNVTGGVYVNGTFCKNPSNIQETVAFFFCQQGYGSSDSDAVKLICAACLCLLFALLFAYVLRDSQSAALGMIAGMFLGFVISIALNLIPLWVFFVIFVLGCILFGLWLYGRQS